MLGKHLGVALQVVVLLVVKASREASATQDPQGLLVLKVSHVHFEILPRVFQSICDQPHVQSEHPSVDLIVPH